MAEQTGLPELAADSPATPERRALNRVRIGIQTWGSEGDIRPFVALGHALAARGHDVEMLYTEISDRRYDEVARVARLHRAIRRVADHHRPRRSCTRSASRSSTPGIRCSRAS